MAEKTEPLDQDNAGPGYKDHPGYEVVRQDLGRSVAVFRGKVKLAETEKAVIVEETAHKPVLYLPFADLNPTFLVETDHKTFCPFKGYARYWTIIADDDGGIPTGENAVWAYDTPYDEVSWIKGLVSFYTDRVSVLIDEKPVDLTVADWPDRR